LYFDSFKLVVSAELYENLKIENKSNNNKIPNKIKNGWYKESNSMPKTICNKAVEKSNKSFDVPF